MKKISILLLLLITSLSLTGCQLALEDTTSVGFLENNELYGYIPVRIDYNIYDSQLGEQTDISDYIFYTWLFSDNLQEEYLVTGVDCGTSMQPIVVSSNTKIIENEDGKTEYKETKETFESDIYISRELEGSPLYPTVTYMNYDGDTVTRQSTGVAMQRGMSMTTTYESVFPDGEKFTLEITISFKIIDELINIEVREYDVNDSLIKTTAITEDTLLEELELTDDTDYIFLIETYEDLTGEQYTERYYYYGEPSVYHKYKFLNEDGFVYLDSLRIYFPD